MRQEVAGVDDQVGPCRIGELGHLTQARAVHRAADVNVRQMRDPQPIQRRWPMRELDLVLIDAERIRERYARQRDRKRRGGAEHAGLLEKFPPADDELVGPSRHLRNPARSQAHQPQQPSHGTGEAEHAIAEQQQRVSTEPYWADPADHRAIQPRSGIRGAGADQLRDHDRIEHGTEHRQLGKHEAVPRQNAAELAVEPEAGIRKRREGDRHQHDYPDGASGAGREEIQADRHQREVQTAQPEAHRIAGAGGLTAISKWPHGFFSLGGERPVSAEGKGTQVQVVARCHDHLDSG